MLKIDNIRSARGTTFLISNGSLDKFFEITKVVTGPTLYHFFVNKNHKEWNRICVRREPTIYNDEVEPNKFTAYEVLLINEESHIIRRDKVARMIFEMGMEDCMKKLITIFAEC